MRRRQGFTLLELLVAMVLSAVLIAMVFRIMGQTLTNNQAIEGSLANLSELGALRRLLGRDLAAVSPTGKGGVKVDAEGFILKTSHDLLLDGPLPVEAAWRFTDREVIREEEIKELRYKRSLSLLEVTGPTELAFFEPKQKIWIDWKSWAAPGVDRPRPGALRLTLEIRKEKVEIVERIPPASSDATTDSASSSGASGSGDQTSADQATSGAK